MNINITEFTNEWIESWNSHDIDKILSHYSDDFEITTPMIKTLLGIETGTLRGKDKIKEYWEMALQKVPDLTFELIDVTVSVNSIAIYYKSVLDKKAIEVMFFDKNNKVNKILAHYTT